MKSVRNPLLLTRQIQVEYLDSVRRLEERD